VSAFDDCFSQLIGNEGAFTADSADSGNWTGGAVGQGQLKGTKYGISAASYPTVDIANLTLDQAKAIYLRDFWNKFGGDSLNPALAFQVFDGAVNSGVSRSVKWLQQAAGVTQDGVIGPQTLAAVNALQAACAICAYNGYRLDFMTDTKVWPTYSRGWAKRVANNLKLLGAQS
jgi:lysozyme family protein